MSWQRDTEDGATEWLVFRKELGGQQVAFLEEVNKNPSLPFNWRLRIQERAEATDFRTGKTRIVFQTVEELGGFRLPVTENLKRVTQKADELLAEFAEVKPKPVEIESGLPAHYGEGRGQWVWKNSRPEWVEVGATQVVVQEHPKPGTAVKPKDPKVDGGKLRNRQLEAQKVSQRG